MSDFLNKFSKGDYKKPDSTGDKKQESSSTNSPQGSFVVSPQTNPSVTPTPDVKHSMSDKNQLTGEKQHEEVFEYDAESKKRRKQRLIIISAIVTVVIVASSVFLYLSGNIKVPEFVGNQVSEAKLWGIQKGVFIDVTEEFDLKVDNGVVKSQEPEEKKTVRKGDTVKLVVSKGADPEELIKLPDFETMKRSEIEAWIKEKRADNVTIVSEYSDTIEKDRFIKKAFKNENVTIENYRRKDSLTITISKGKEEFDKNIKMPDFTGKSQAEVSAWGETNKVAIDFVEVYSETIPQGMVVSQSIAPNEMISKIDTLSVSISKGKATIVPNFGGLSKDQAQARASEAGVSVSIVEVYNGSVGFGGFISQSIGAGTILSNPSTVVTLHFSLGVPFIPDFAGKPLQEVVQIIAGMNNQGANLNYSVVETFDQSVPPGIVIMNDNVGRSGFGLGTVIKVSAGGQIQVPTTQLLGSAYESEATKLIIEDLKARGLKVVTMYYSTNATVNGRPVASGEIAELMVLEGTTRRFIGVNEVLNSGSQVLQIVIQK